MLIMKLIEFTEHFFTEESCEQHLKAVRQAQGVVCVLNAGERRIIGTK